MPEDKNFEQFRQRNVWPKKNKIGDNPEAEKIAAREEVAKEEAKKKQKGDEDTSSTPEGGNS